MIRSAAGVLAVVVTCTGIVAARQRPATWNGIALPADVPEEALQALAQGRNFRAARILDAWLATADTTPEALLLSARAASGWFDWEGVVGLLDGQPWLDVESGGIGWSLLGRAELALGNFDRASAALDRFAAIAGDAAGRDVGMARVRRAEALRQLGRTADALASYDAALPLLPDIGDWIHVAAAEAAASDGDTAEVNRRLGRVDAAIAKDWGWSLRLDARRNAADTAGAIALARETATASSGSTRARAALMVAELSRDRDPAGARAAYRQAMDASPGTIAGIDAARALTEMGGLTAEDRLEIGRIYLRHGNYDRAVEGIEAYLKASRLSARETERLRMQLAHALFNGRRYDDAERQFLAVAESPTSAAVGAEALFYAGRSQYRDGRASLGERTFERVADRYPGQPSTAQALYILADLAEDDAEYDVARRDFRRALDSGVGVEEVGFANMRLAGLAAVDGDWDEAASLFDGYLRRWPTGRRAAQATYWSALAHRKLGHEDIARQRLESLFRSEPTSYYGGQAALLLGRSVLDFPMGDSPARDDATDARIADAFAPYDLLKELDWDQAADWQLRRVRERHSGATAEAYALAEALNQRGLAMTGIGLGWDLFRRGGGWNPRLLRIIYPFPFRGMIVAEAEANDVDPFLAAGLIRQESMFQPEARSGANAIGLMQVIPETGEVLAQRLGVPRFRDDMLTLAEINVLLGMSYLKEQLDAYDGRLPLVLGAYNAGPHRITRWSEFPQFPDDELFTERIPFEETRDYVKIVQQNARLYAALWGE